MRQRLHPDETWAKPYRWTDVPVEDLPALGTPIATNIEGDHLAVAFTGGGLRVAAVAAGIFRLDWTPAGGECRALPAGLAAVVLDDAARDAQAVISERGCQSGGWSLRLVGGGVQLVAPDGAVAVDLRHVALAPAPHGVRMLADFALAEPEHLHGFGGRTGPVDRRGHTFDQLAVKVDGPKNGDYGGLPMPFCLSSRGAAIFFDNPWPHVYADLGYERADTMRWYCPDGPGRLYLIGGPDPAEILRRWYLLTGRPTLPPRWYFGMWMSWTARWTARDWQEWIARFRAEGWPLDVAVLDLDWRGGQLMDDGEGGDGRNLDWAPTFGDGPALIRQAKARPRAMTREVCGASNPRQGL